MKSTRRFCRICMVAITVAFGVIFCLPQAARSFTVSIYSHYRGIFLSSTQKPNVGEPLLFNVNAFGPYDWNIHFCGDGNGTCQTYKRASTQSFSFAPPYPGNWLWSLTATDAVTGQRSSASWHFDVIGTSVLAIGSANKGGPQANPKTVFDKPG